MDTGRRSGRPMKAEEEKVRYQRIAIYFEDYEKLTKEIRRRKIKDKKYGLTDAFAEMVAKYMSES